MADTRNEPNILFSNTEIDITEPPTIIVNNNIDDHSPITDTTSRYNAPVYRHVPSNRKDRRHDGLFHGDTKYVSLLSALAVVVGFIALVIGGVGLARGRGDIVVNVSSGSDAAGRSNLNTVKSSSDNSSRVWSFAIGNYNSRLEYIDPTTGQVRGYNVDVVHAVCRIARKNCEFVWDLYERCWSSIAGQQPRGGVGLLGGWYDACTAWSVTYERTRTFDFTANLSKQRLSVFMVKIGTPSSAFNWRDLTGETIGFLQSYADDEICVRRITQITGSKLNANQIRYYNTQQELLTAVNNDEVDAAFVSEFLEVNLHLQIASDKLDNCRLGGQAIMTKKDSLLADWWNPAFQTLLQTTEYRQICEDIEDGNIHGTLPGPNIAEQCVGF